MRGRYQQDNFGQSFTSTRSIQPAGDGCPKLPLCEQQKDEKLFLSFLKGCLDLSGQNSCISCLFPKALALCWCVNLVIMWTGKSLN